MSLEARIQKLLNVSTGSYKGFKVGDKVRNINKRCMHYGSIGRVTKIEAIPNNSGFLIYYSVENQGSTYRPGTILSKTEDQLEKA